MICSKCNGVNDKNNKYCSLCGDALIENQNEIKSVKDDYEDGYYNVPVKKVHKGCLIIIISFLAEFLLIGLFILVVSLYEYIPEKIQYKGYERTTAYFVEYVDCYETDDSTLCYEKFEYKIDGKKYYYIMEEATIEEYDFDVMTIKLLYKPDNPSEVIVGNSYDFWFVIGFVIVGICIVIIVSTYILAKKLFKKDGDFRVFIGDKNDD